MEDKKIDLRIKKTQRALATAMLSLLETSTFSKITVNDLCTEALVSRSAFYSHFQDKYALLQFCMDVLRERLFSEYDGAAFDLRMRTVLLAVQKHKRILRNIIGTELDFELTAMMRKSFQKDMENALLRRNKTTADLPGPPDILAVYYSTGITGAIMYWLSKSQPDPVDDLVKSFGLLLSL